MFQSEIKIANWHEQADAKAILSEIVDNPPAYVRNPLDHPLDGSPRWLYDRTDERVQKLFWFASGWFAATNSFDLTVDEVIGQAVATYRSENGHAARKAFWLQLGFTLGEAVRRADMGEPIDMPADDLTSSLEAQ